MESLKGLLEYISEMILLVVGLGVCLLVLWGINNMPQLLNKFLPAL